MKSRRYSRWSYYSVNMIWYCWPSLQIQINNGFNGQAFFKVSLGILNQGIVSSDRNQLLVYAGALGGWRTWATAGARSRRPRASSLGGFWFLSLPHEEGRAWGRWRLRVPTSRKAPDMWKRSHFVAREIALFLSRENALICSITITLPFKLSK